MAEKSTVSLSVPKNSRVEYAGFYNGGDFILNGPSFANCNQIVTYTVSNASGAEAYNWTWPSGWTVIGGLGTSSITLRTSSQSGQVSVRLGSCGFQGGSPGTIFTNVSGCGARIAVYPNPTSQQLQVEFDRTESAELLPEQLAIYSEHSARPVRVISVRDIYNHKAFRDGNKVDVDVHSLPRGVYYIHLIGSKQKAGEAERIRIILN